jgi:hypothetical protein
VTVEVRGVLTLPPALGDEGLLPFPSGKLMLLARAVMLFYMAG